MKKIMMIGFTVSLLAITSCSKVPLTGRNRFSFVNDGVLQQQAAIGYAQLLSDPKIKVLAANTTEAARVKSIGEKIKTVVTQYMNENGFAEQIKSYKWEFNLIESPEINAWCMPGGKVAVYTGILKVTKDDAGLATVMGHEIAHAIAQHSAERASRMVAAQVGGGLVGATVANKSDVTQAIVNQIYGIGAPALVILPNSRNQELEADKMGLSFMAMAGYNPENAIGFWERMAQASKGGQKPPAFLSTHPTDDLRIERIKKALPDALKYFKQ